jgi:hypothetical protein
MHKQNGPALRALVLSHLPDATVRQYVEKKFESSKFDPSSSKAFKRKAFVNSKEEGRKQGRSDEAKMMIPKVDFLSELPSNILSNLVSIFRLHLCQKFMLC